MKTFKRILASLMVAVMVLTAAPLSGFVGLELNFDWLDFNTKASAATYSGTCGDDLSWTLDKSTGELVISGTGDMYNYDYDSTPWYSYISSIRTVIISDGVTSIGSYAFDYCTSLKSITIPDSVASIGDGAFLSCWSITSIIIPDSVTHIGNYVFTIGDCAYIYAGKGVKTLSFLDVPDTTMVEMHFSGSLEEWCQLDGFTDLYYDSLYLNGSKVEGDLVIPDGIKRIGANAFNGLNDITSVTIPDSVTSIGRGAFRYCESLTSITFGNGVTSIGDSAFSGCYSLTRIAIPDSVTSIDYDAFYDCIGITELTMPISAKIYNNSDTFGGCTNIEKITLTKGNGTVQNYSTSTSYNETNTYYGYTPWYISGCPEIVIEEGVTAIGSYTFYNCTNLDFIHYLGDSSQLTVGSSALSRTSAEIHDCIAVSTSPLVCTQEGLGNWYCEECNENIVSDVEFSALGHDFGDWQETTVPTCTETGVETRSCSRCDVTETRVSDTLGHDFSDWQVTTAPTCTETGVDTKYCSRCDVTETRVSDALGHDWSNNDGICARDNCGLECEHPEESITWETVVEPTCAPGLEYGSCNICGIKKTETIVCDSSTYPESPHNYTNNYSKTWNFSYAGANKLILKFSSSTQTENNYDYIYIYNSAGTQIGKYSGTQLSDTEIEVEGSSFQIKLTSDSSQVYYGFKFDSITAIVESVGIEREIPAISDHDWSNNDGICANGCGTGCSHPSFTQGECDACGSTCAVIGHDFGDWKVTTAPTCNEIGIDTKYCSRCDATETRPVVALGHNLAENSNVCSVCGKNGGTCGTSLIWTLEENGTLIISGTGVMTNYSDAASVTWYTLRPFITSVVITDGVTSVGNYAFYSCAAVTELTMPVSAKIYNSSNTFSGCTNIEKITLTKGNGTVQNYGTSTSSSSTNTYHEYTPWYISKCSEIVIEDGVTGIGSYAFSGCTGLTSVTIPDSATSIGSYTFSDCTGITSVTIPDSVTNIGSSVFRGCTGLISVTIGSGLTSLSTTAFNGCSSLASITVSEDNGYFLSDEFGVLYDKNKTKLVLYPGGNERVTYTIPFSVVEIAPYAFNTCPNLLMLGYPGNEQQWATVTVGSNNEIITDILVVDSDSENAVYKSGTCGENLEWVLYVSGELVISGTGDMDEWDYYISDSGDFHTYAPWDSRRDFIRSVTIGEGVTSISEHAFAMCTSLESVTIPESVTSIDAGAFVMCSSLKTVTIPDSVTKISISTFEGCTSLTDVIIGNGVTYIGDYVFLDCSNLKNVTIPASVTFIDCDTFKDCTALENVYYGGDLVSWCAIHIAEADSNPLYYADNLYFNGELVTDIIIPESVTSIGSYAFYGYSNLKSVHYLGDETQVTIPDNAFEGTSATVHYCVVVGNPPSTCTQLGEGSWYCEECNKEITDKFDIPALGHNFGEWQETTAPTCTETGIETKFCSRCDVTETRAVDALGHDLGEWQETTVPTCTETGVETKFCSRCDVTETRVADALGHDWSNKDGVCARENCGLVCEHPEESITWETVVEPTCVSGLEQGFCDVCGIVKDKAIVCDKSTYPESPHNYSDSYNRTWSFSYAGANKLILKFSSSTKTENNYDFIYIYNSSGAQIGKYCGTQLSGAEIEVEGSSFQIKLTSDGSNTNYGFKFDSITAVIEVSAIEREIPAVSDHDWSNKDGVCANDCGTECLHESFTDGECDVCGGTCSTLGHAYDADLEECTVCGHNCTTMGHIFNSANTECEVCGFLKGTCGDSLTWTLDLKGQLVISGTGAMYYYLSSSVVPWNNSGIPITRVVIGDGVTSIGNYAFYNCTGLTELTMPISAKIFNSSNTFYNCYNIEKITLTKGNGTVQSYSNSTGYSDTYYGYTPWYISGCSEIVIEDGVTGIGSCTFYNCTGLTNVTIGNSVTSIGNSAFSGCTGLTSVTIPDSVTSIDNEAFYNCSGLTELTMPISAKIYNSSFTFHKCYNIDKITLTKGNGTAQNYDTSSYSSNTCYQYTPWYISGCSEIVIADGVTSIGSYTFYNCTGLTSVTIGNGVANIGSCAFYGCTGLANITIPDSVTRIGSSVWYSCSNADVYFTGDLADWCAITFESYSANPKNSVRNLYINGELMAGELIIPDGVTSIGHYAFYNFTGITSVTIPVTLTSIGNEAFYGCDGIEITYYPGTMTEWNRISLGSQNWKLTENVIFECNSDVSNYGSGTCGDNIAWILYTDGELVLSGTGAMVEDFESTSMTTWQRVADKVTSVIIDDRITSIGALAFYGCYNLNKITIPDSVTNIGAYAFAECDSLTEITIPDSVTTIGDYVFGGCDSLTEITIPDSVTTIGDYAFGGCDSLTEIAIPDSVTSIGDWAFAECETLTNVTIGNGVTSIGDYAFGECVALTSITIPDSVTTIGEWAFSYCVSLTNVTIGTGVTEIGNFAFALCQELEEIIFLGEEKISLGKHLFVIEVNDELETIVDNPNLIIGCKENSWMHFYVESNDKRYCLLDSDGNPAFEIKGDSLVSYRGSADSVYLSQVTQIGYGAFENNSTIEKVEFAPGVKRIYNSAFRNCSELKVVIIPQSVTSIGANAFNGCDGVTFWCYAGSYADEYALSHNIDVEYISFHIDNDVVYLAPDEQMTITYSLNIPLMDNVSVDWISTDESIVTVDANGKLNGVRAGTAVIVATTKDGGLSDYCIVKVAGIEALSTVNIDYDNGFISGFAANTTSLDGLIGLTDSSCNLDYSTLGTDSVVYVERGNEIVEAYTILIYGDVNGDGWYDGQDAVLVACLANGILTQDDVSEAVYMAADCNHDGVIDQLDVDLLNQAGTLLANVDQSKPTEVLLETSSAYVEYLDLIDQSPEIEVEDETDTEFDTDTDAEQEETPEADVDPTPEQDKAEVNIFEMIINFIKSIFELFLTFIPVPYK